MKRKKWKKPKKKKKKKKNWKKKKKILVGKKFKEFNTQQVKEIKEDFAKKKS